MREQLLLLLLLLLLLSRLSLRASSLSSSASSSFFLRLYFLSLVMRWDWDGEEKTRKREIRESRGEELSEEVKKKKFVFITENNRSRDDINYKR